VDYNVRVLRYVVSVADEGHFGRAASKLYVDPAVLTRQVRRLEQQLGFTLLDRTVHPIVPTASGAVFLAAARTILEAVERANAIADIERRRSLQSFVLGFVMTPLGKLTRRVVEAFGRRAGEDVLKLVELPVADQTAAVLDGRVDVSLAWSPLADTQLRVEPAASIARVIIVSDNHPLARRSSVCISETNRDKLIQVVPELVGDPAWLRWWAVDPRPDGVPVQYGAKARTVPEVIEEVAAGRGIAITSEIVAATYRRPDIAFVPIEDIEPARILLCTRTDDNSPWTTLMREIIRALNEDMQAGVYGEPED
jgi:DNA-binding transcriptional LysR family regulator